MNKETLKQIIIDTIKGEEHLGENLKNQCVVYIEQLQNNWNELKKGLQSLFEFDYGVVSKDYLECAEDTLDKIQELEQGSDSE